MRCNPRPRSVDEAPRFEVVNPDAELSDDAIRALAALLLDVVEKQRPEKKAASEEN